MKKISVQDALDKDIYSIFYQKGVKKIKFWGYIYDAGNFVDEKPVYNTVEICWCETTLKQFLSEEFDVGEFQSEFKQYCGYVNDSEAEYYINQYFGKVVMGVGSPFAPLPMKLDSIDLHTPCGDYIDI